MIDLFAKSPTIICRKENCLYPNACSENKDACLCAFENAEVFSITNINNNNNMKLNNSYSHLKTQEYKINKNKNYIYCEYKRKSKKIYLVLELFFNIGIGHLYIGDFKMARLKVVLLSLPWFLFALLLIKRKISLDDNKVNCNMLPVLFYLIWIFWWLYDLVTIFTGKFKDEYGVTVI